MKKLLCLLICLGNLIQTLQADEIKPEEKDSIKILEEKILEEEIGLIPESLDANVDSLLHSWHVQYFTKQEDYCHDDDANIFFPDSVYADRLNRLPSVISLP